jgi:hypothetical protein
MTHDIAELERLLSRPPAATYRVYDKKKPTGDTRRIREPLPNLMSWQRAVSEQLEGLALRSEFCFGTKPGVSEPTVRALEIHHSSSWFARIDIRDFFGSVRPEHVVSSLALRGVPERLVRHALPALFVDGGLPQGAPTSSVLADATLFSFDCEIALAARFSRYVDDIVLSGDDRPALLDAVDTAVRLLHLRGFHVQRGKRIVFHRDRPVELLGRVIFREQIRLSPRLRRRVRDRQRVHRKPDRVAA